MILALKVAHDTDEVLKNMKLNEKDYREIAAQVQQGSDTIEYVKDGETLFIDYTFDIEGYVEDDYYNGTGGFVETDRTFSVERADLMTADGDVKPYDVDESILEKFVA